MYHHSFVSAFIHETNIYGEPAMCQALFQAFEIHIGSEHNTAILVFVRLHSILRETDTEQINRKSKPYCQLVVEPEGTGGEVEVGCDFK